MSYIKRLAGFWEAALVWILSPQYVCNQLGVSRRPRVAYSSSQRRLCWSLLCDCARGGRTEPACQRSSKPASRTGNQIRQTAKHARTHNLRQVRPLQASWNCSALWSSVNRRQLTHHIYIYIYLCLSLCSFIGMSVDMRFLLILSGLVVAGAALDVGGANNI